MPRRRSGGAGRVRRGLMARARDARTEATGNQASDKAERGPVPVPAMVLLLLLGRTAVRLRLRTTSTYSWERRVDAAGRRAAGDGGDGAGENTLGSGTEMMPAVVVVVLLLLLVCESMLEVAEARVGKRELALVLVAVAVKVAWDAASGVSSRAAHGARGGTQREGSERHSLSQHPSGMRGRRRSGERGSDCRRSGCSRGSCARTGRRSWREALMEVARGGARRRARSRRNEIRVFSEFPDFPKFSFFLEYGGSSWSAAAPTSVVWVAAATTKEQRLWSPRSASDSDCGGRKTGRCQ
jgi:hypothetical protein